jgi:hypothetical protein
MKWKIFLLLVFNFTGMNSMESASNFIPAHHPYIQYYGRWDLSDTNHAKYSWPGVYIQTVFTGTRIGIRLTDNINYFNVYIDGALRDVFHGTEAGIAEYILVDNLPNTKHTLALSRRNITFDAVYSFEGFVLDSAASLLLPPPKPLRKIEFIGDSFTAAESNEAKEQSLPWEARFPVTNIDKGFAVDIARHFHAQYQTTCRSGAGLVCDWQGKRDGTLPIFFDRTLMEASEPKWDFSKWIPDVVVICLGLNDHSGLKDKEGNVSVEKSELFRQGYHDFLKTIRTVYPGVKIVAVAAFPEWIQKNVQQVVKEETQNGRKDICYAHFDDFPGGYVANGHPTVATHQKIADQIIDVIEKNNIFSATK